MYQRSPVADSVEIQSNGGFLFSDVPLGRYIIEAFPGPTEENPYLTTYFFSAGRWEDAKQIVLDKSVSETNLYISVPEKTTLTGEATLTGLVTEIDGDDVLKSTMGKPSPRAKAKLAKSKTKSDLEIIAETYTDQYGNFTFSNVEDGDYFIIIDIEGLPCIKPYEVAITGGMYVSNLDYLADEETVTSNGEPTITKVYNPDNNQGVLVYPVPSNGIIHIDFDGQPEIEQLILTDIQGKIIINLNNISDNKIRTQHF